MSRMLRFVAGSALLSLVGCATAPAAQPTAPTAPVVAETPAPSDLIESDVLELPRPITSFGATSHEGALYLYGGYSGVPHAYSREGQSGELVKLDPATRAVTKLADGEGVQGAWLVSTPKGLVRLGGMRAMNADGEKEQLDSLRDVARFDAATARWEPLLPLPEGRSSHAAIVHNGRLYVFGGWVLSGDRATGRFATQAFAFDLEAGTYETLEQPFKARAVGVGMLGDKIAVVGGIDESARPQSGVHLFDPKTSTWSKGPDFPGNAFGVSVASAGGSLFASAKDGILYELASPTGTWTPAALLAFPRFFHQLVTLDERRIAVFGGIAGMSAEGRIAHVEIVDVRAEGPRVLRFKLKNPSPAKNRQGVGILGSSLIAFGGNRSLGQHDFGPEDFRTEAFALNLANMRFTPLPPFPEARQTVQTLTLGDQLFALGGFGHDGEKARAHAEATLFDAETGTWKADRSVLPSPRTQFGLTAVGDDLWVFGGLDYDPSRAEAQQFHHPVTVMKAKRGQPFAESGVNLPHPRRAFGGAQLDGKYYLVGGMADGFAPVTHCDVFTFADASWSTIPCPAQRISPQLVALGEKLYLAGGSTPGGGQELVPNGKLEVFDPKTGAWSTLLEQIPIEPRHLTVLPYENALLMYSAHADDGTVQVVMVVPSPSNTSKP